MDNPVLRSLQVAQNIVPPDVSGQRFHVVVAGNTNGTHSRFVSLIKRSNYIEVHSPQESDFVLVFCPVASRVGTDIQEALQNVDRNRIKILVVMHHTFDPYTVIAESRRQVEDPNVLLTVDCLFYESELLNCDRNNIALHQICRSLAISSPQTPYKEQMINWSYRKLWIAIAVLFATAVIICWSLYGTKLWISIVVLFAGAGIIIFCKNKFGINNNSALAIAVVFSGAVIILHSVFYHR